MENNKCKYCFETDNLIYPCDCKSGVHLKCIEKWMKYKNCRNMYICEICNKNQRDTIELYKKKTYYTYFSYENFMSELNKV